MTRTVGIVSLSSGSLGEPNIRFEMEIGVKRLEEMGLQVRFLPHALLGREYILNHPEARAADLLQAFRDPEIDLILCAIGGDDTLRLCPWLFDHDELRQAMTRKPFLGFSDTTINHLMLHKLGLPTFYGQSFLSDVCELSPEMLPYTRTYFEEFIRTGTIREVRPSEVWYSSRQSYGPDQVGVPLTEHPDRGFELLQGPSVFSGPILGGCIDSLYDFLDGEHDEQYRAFPALAQKYGIFPDREDWRGRILLLESSEMLMPPEAYRRALECLKERGVFSVISGILVGKPMDETYQAEYHRILVETAADPSLPILANLNIGHALPRCILPFGINARVDAAAQRITFPENFQISS